MDFAGGWEGRRNPHVHGPQSIGRVLNLFLPLAKHRNELGLVQIAVARWAWPPTDSIRHEVKRLADDTFE